MYIKRVINRSGTTSVIVAEKVRGANKHLKTIGVSSDDSQIAQLIHQGKDWITKELEKRHPNLDLFGEEHSAKQFEIEQAQQFISQIDNIVINGTQLILDRVFDSVGFDQIEDKVFRQLVLSRLAFPVSKAATVDYLKNYYDKDINLSKIYRYFDKLNNTQQEIVQEISVNHTAIRHTIISRMLSELLGLLNQRSRCAQCFTSIGEESRLSSAFALLR